MVRYITFSKGSNHHQSQEISQISLNVEYSQLKRNVTLGYLHLKLIGVDQKLLPILLVFISRKEGYY